MSRRPIHADWRTGNPFGIDRSMGQVRAIAEGQASRFIHNLCGNRCFLLMGGTTAEDARAAEELVMAVAKAAVRKGWGKRDLTGMRDIATLKRPRPVWGAGGKVVGYHDGKPDSWPYEPDHMSPTELRKFADTILHLPRQGIRCGRGRGQRRVG